MKIKTSFIALSGLCLAACDNTTDTLGIFTESDNITASAGVYEIHTRSMVAGSVLCNSNRSYLGLMTDPETGMDIKAEFLAQFATLEDYEFPNHEMMVKNELGEIVADSIELRLYYTSSFGNDNNPMKVDVYELDTANVIREDKMYYSNDKLTQYINPRNKEPLARKVFTARDFTLPDNILDGDSYLPHIRIMLPREYGTFILRKYYENKDFFKTSYNFIHHVCPGFYFKLSNGNGTMLGMKVGTMNVYFKYKEEGKDEEVVGMARFSATPEVLQNTHIENGNLEEWVADKTDCTYLKTPAGIFTEVTLPIDEIYRGHEKDSISQAQVAFYRYNVAEENRPNALGIPQNLLMVRKDDMKKFFEEQRITDNKTSYIASFNSSTNSYTFSNIGNLITYCKNFRQKNEDWNKVVLIPVEVGTDDNSNVISVTHDMGLGSARLVGGENNPVSLQIIYSSFQ